MPFRSVIPVAAGLVVASASFAFVQTKRLEAMKLELQVEQLELKSCGTRIANIIEDLESDNAIDSLPPDALLDVPDSWLFDPNGGN